MSTPQDPPVDPDAVADAMRDATERLREQAWMIEGVTSSSALAPVEALREESPDVST